MSLTINFFRPVWEARLRFDAHVVNRSKNTGHVECDVTDPGGKLIAKAMSTCTVLRGDRQRSADRLMLRGLYLSQEFLQQRRGVVLVVIGSPRRLTTAASGSDAAVVPIVIFVRVREG